MNRFLKSIKKKFKKFKAEVQNVHSDGSLSLHTRNLNYGKLGQGCLIQVSSPMIKRQKVHFVNLPCGVSIILGRNGFIWVTSTSIQESSRKNGGFTPLLKVIISFNFSK